MRFICSSLLLSAASFCLFAAQVLGLEEPKAACYNDKGKPVDWYIGYKFPQIPEDARFSTGYSYALLTSEDVGELQERIKASANLPEQYENNGNLSLFLYRFREMLLRYSGMTSRLDLSKFQDSPRRARKSKAGSAKGANKAANKLHASDARWKLSPHLITDQKSALLKTLTQASENEKLDVLFYNDDPGESALGSEERTKKGGESSNSNRAHAKGSVIFDQGAERGIWVTHSVPKLPQQDSDKPSYPESARLYGQTFICVTFDLDKAGKTVIEHLRVMRPQVYNTRISKQLYDRFPELLDIDDNSKSRKIRTSEVLSQTLLTSSGQLLDLFSKSRDFGKDLYSGYIDEELGSALYVETWRRGPKRLESSCPNDDFHVNNVQDLKFDNAATWSYLKDHSKWAISDSQDDAYVCIGDINRAETQFQRGGGAICLKCPACWKAFSNTIADLEPCPIRSNPKSQTSVDEGLVTRVASFFHLR